MKINSGGIITDLDIPFVEHLIPVTNITSRPQRIMTPTSITVHNTGNEDADAEDNSKFVDKTEVYTSWHFTIGDNIVYQELPVYEVSYHAGDGYNGVGNTTSISIEVSEEEGDASYQTAIKFVARLLYWFGWDVDNVVPHKHWKSKRYPNGKNCPRKILPVWDSDFIPSIEKELAILKREEIMSERVDIKFTFDGQVVRDLDLDTIQKLRLIGKLDDYSLYIEPSQPKLYEYCGRDLQYGMWSSSDYVDVLAYQKAINLIRVSLGLSKISEDGQFGNEGKNSCISFQTKYGLPVNGIVDEATANKMNEVLIMISNSNPNEGNNTPSDFDSFEPLVKLEREFSSYTKFGQSKVVQFCLDELGFELEIDGHFGNGSEYQLNKYKESKGLEKDGLVDELTWKWLHYDLEQKHKNEDLRINWYDNQTKVVRVKRSEVDMDVIMGNQPVESVYSVYDRLEEKPLLIFNGALFGMSGGETLSLVVDEGVEINWGVYSKWFMGQSFDGDIKLYGGNWEKQTHDGNLDHIKEGIGGSPSLIVGGKKNLDLTGLDYGFIHYKHPRIIFALDEEYVYVIIVHGRDSTKGYYGATIDELVEICLALGIVDAINLDGGGSITLLDKDGKAIDEVDGVRKVDNMIALMRRK